MNMINNESVRQGILDDMIEIITGILPTNAYALKGGYVLKNILNSSPSTRDVRHTSDIDIDLSVEEYYDLIICGLTPYLDSLVQRDIIHSYSCRPLKHLKDGRFASAAVRLYRKRDENSPKFVYCGVDMNIHPLYYGVVSFNGIPVYSLERIVSDKFLALYTGDREQILHRVKDVLDLYLIDQYIKERGVSLDFKIIATNITERLGRGSVADLRNPSHLERLFISDYNSVVISMERLIKSNRVSKEMLNYSSSSAIIRHVIEILNSLRCSYYEQVL